MAKGMGFGYRRVEKASMGLARKSCGMMPKFKSVVRK